MPKKKAASKSSKLKRSWKKIWYFIWEDDSWMSWVVNIILAFILIKFIVYPVLGLVFATSHPIVAVVSSSMEHDEPSFDDWWDSYAMCDNNIDCTQSDFYSQVSITKDDFKHYRYKNGFNKGDIMILFGTKPEKIDVGDVIVFQADRPDPIIHRVIYTNEHDGEYMFTTKGDNNPASFYFEAYIPEENYIGRAILRIPLLGYIKIGFVKLMSVLGIL